MMSEIPGKISKLKGEDLDCEVLRAALIGELDAINLYEQAAAMTQNPRIKAVLLDIAKEEKTHVGELQTLLLMSDKQQAAELENGRKEVEHELGKLG